MTYRRFFMLALVAVLTGALLGGMSPRLRQPIDAAEFYTYKIRIQPGGTEQAAHDYEVENTCGWHANCLDATDGQALDMNLEPDDPGVDAYWRSWASCDFACWRAARMYVTSGDDTTCTETEMRIYGQFDGKHKGTVDYYHVDPDEGAWHDIYGNGPDNWEQSEHVVGVGVVNEPSDTCDLDGNHVHQRQSNAGGWMWNILSDNYPDAPDSAGFVDTWHFLSSQAELYFEEYQ